MKWAAQFRAVTFIALFLLPSFARAQAPGDRAETDPISISAAIKQLSDTNDTTRRMAAYWLGDPERKRASLITPPNYDPLTNAAALPPANPKVTAALLYMAENDEFFPCRWTAADALTKIAPKEALEMFIKDLGSTNSKTRGNAARDLGFFKKGARAAIPSLVKCLSDSNAAVRLKAAVTLREIGERPDIVVPALLKGISDPDIQTREAVGIALGAFGSAGKPAVPQIIKMLNHPSNGGSWQGLFQALDHIDPAAADKYWKKSRKEPPPAIKFDPLLSPPPPDVR